MQYFVRNRRRLRPATGELMPMVAQPDPAPVADGSGPHRRPLVTEINLTRPFQGRVR